MSISAYLEKRSRPFWAIIGLILVMLVGLLDTLTGYELSFSLFYLIPISIATWFGGRRCGILITVFSAIAWITADTLAGHHYSHAAIQYWDALIRLGFFLTTAILLSELKAALARERDLARMDSLTGAVNKRYFNERLRDEIKRTHRYGHPFTLAYVDLDNFKQINDSHGHSEGDKVLFSVVKKAREELRASDMVARLGGDEFALLLPETGQAEAKICIAKMQCRLLEEMQEHNWPVTFSMGVLTCLTDSCSVDELIGRADRLMYEVKRSGKNAVRYATFGG